MYTVQLRGQVHPIHMEATVTNDNGCRVLSRYLMHNIKRNNKALDIFMSEARQADDPASSELQERLIWRLHPVPETGKIYTGTVPCGCKFKEATMDREALEEALNSIMFKHKGMLFERSLTSPEAIDALEHMEIRDSDVFLVTYPKSGTVWTQQILSLIFNEGHRNGTEQIQNLDRAPWIEANINNVDFTSRPSPRLFTSHLSYNLMPRDLRFRVGKIIYVCRNPKDAMVSFYHFYKLKPNVKCTINWDTFIEFFVSGRVACGSWFDHVRGWYTHKEDFNLLFVTYEEMRKDLRSAVKKICTFVGINLDEKAIDIVVEKATFRNMKQDPLANYSFVPGDYLDQSKGDFLRKGMVGDWKNIMTVAQSEIFDKVYEEKMGDLPINFLWDLKEETAS